LVAFVLMLIIFHHSKTKPFCLASFLARTKKSRLQGGKPQFFPHESSPNKRFLP
jgi:hypothetical protein